MPERKRAAEIDARLKTLYPKAAIALAYANDFQLLVAVILSAQTTDVGVNKVTPVLFDRFPTAEALAAADPDEIEDIVRPTGFFRNKTKNIMGAAQRIVAEYGGTVPDTMEDLLTLPGVARKTANIVLYNAFGKAEGIAVDTHVFRLSHRLGFSVEQDTNKVERDLMALFPREEWGALTYRLIEHGRTVCDAKRPICGRCTLAELCPSAFSVKGWRESA
ncbi:MAG: endonuclease III [Actinobacteria bacterium]|nr:endonuclease III [Actinomycetota bacterium]